MYVYLCAHLVFHYYMPTFAASSIECFYVLVGFGGFTLNAS